MTVLHVRLETGYRIFIHIHSECIASFAPSSTSVYSSSDNSGGSSSSSYSGSTGTGATKTVVVAPTQVIQINNIYEICS